jgi:large subunit ribosomal protein L29
MGKGKGNVEGYVAVVKPGRVMFEVAGVTRSRPSRPCASPATSSPSRPRSCGGTLTMKLSEIRKELLEARKLSPAELEKLIRQKKRSSWSSASRPPSASFPRTTGSRRPGSIARLLTVWNEKRRQNA